MVECHIDGCDGEIKKVGRSKGVCSKCSAKYIELTSGNWMLEGGASRKDYPLFGDDETPLI